MDEKKLKKYFSFCIRKGDILFSEMVAVEEKIERLISNIKIEIANMNIRIEELENRIEEFENQIKINSNLTLEVYNLIYQKTEKLDNSLNQQLLKSEVELGESLKENFGNI